MQIIYDDKHVNRSGDSFRLILLNSGWHVVGKGYLCRVADSAEGREMIVKLKSRQADAHPLCRPSRAGCSITLFTT
jgi:hypothetical protein